MVTPVIFRHLLLAWFSQYGRKNLPWQHPQTPYRVWVSEIMLQQTQVTTVIPYFETFIHSFPTVEALAAADLDSVLQIWAGLGYYARARHLHESAQRIMQEFQGALPNNLQALQSLPGIGRSTAGAILSLGFNQPAPILDGNVKRLFCRLHMIEGYLSEGRVMKQLWQLAEEYIPCQNARDYTQALMDFGALICTRHQPQCNHCPLTQHCLAYLKQRTDQYPRIKRSQPLITKAINFMVLLHPKNKTIFLEKRPPTGIWGGLWSLPECPKEIDLHAWCVKNYHCTIASIHQYPVLYHKFSHFQLAIQPLVCQVESIYYPLQDNTSHGWFNHMQAMHQGLAAPIKKLLQNFHIT
jgi:A/G-specific adenine glycosylase